MIIKNEPLSYGFTVQSGETGDLFQWLLTRDALIRTRDLIAAGPTLVSAKFQPPNTLSVAQMNSAQYTPKILGTEVYRFDDNGVDGRVYLSVAYCVIKMESNKNTACLLLTLGRGYSESETKLGGLLNPVQNKAFLYLPLENYPYSYGYQNDQPAWTFGASTPSGVLFTTANSRDWGNTSNGQQRGFLYIGRSFSATTSLPTNEVIIAARFNSASWAGGIHDLYQGNYNQNLDTRFNYAMQWMLTNPQGTVNLAVNGDLFTMLPNDNNGATALNDEFLMGGPYVYGAGYTMLLFSQGSPALLAPSRARQAYADVVLGADTWHVTPVDACFMYSGTGGKLWLKSS